MNADEVETLYRLFGFALALWFCANWFFVYMYHHPIEGNDNLKWQDVATGWFLWVVVVVGSVVLVNS